MKRITGLLTALVMCCVMITSAAQTISVHTQSTALIYSVGPGGELQQVYLGPGIADSAVETSFTFLGDPAYPGGGMNYVREPAIEAAHTDGNLSLRLIFTGDSISYPAPDQTLTRIFLKDAYYPFFVTLYFKSFYRENVIEQWTSIRQEENGPVSLLRFASAFISLDDRDFYLTHFYGDWASEMQFEEIRLPEGNYSIQSKLGTRATNYTLPSFMISPDKPASETEGEVFAGTLAWSGNFDLKFENIRSNGHAGNSLKLIAGINAYGSAYQLPPGKIFNTPHFIFTYTKSGKGQASRNLQAWALNDGIWKGHQLRQTLLNNWETTGFHFTQDTLVHLFDDARKLGVGLFLLDDGWFGNNHPRNGDTAGLGDWQANKKILPGGIEYLVKKAAEKGVRFGIWIEPEMVNPKSDLYENHPDWVLKLPNRPLDLSRNQLILDLSNPAVRDFVYGVLHRLLQENPGIAYLKWDCNRYMTNPYSEYLGKQQQNLSIDYVEGLYQVMHRIRQEYPDLEMMLCSGGGGRAEYGALHYFNEFWPSDNTDAVQRILIQWGYSYFFPAATQCDHVTSWGNEPLKFRVDVAMQGKLGFDINVDKLSSREIEFCREAVENYKKWQSLINYGNLYRLISPYNNTSTSLMYLDSNRQHAIVFAYNLYTRQGDAFEKLKLQGLDSTKNYRVEEINLEEDSKPAFRQSGRVYPANFLMQQGLDWYLYGQLKSSVLILTAQ